MAKLSKLPLPIKNLKKPNHAQTKISNQILYLNQPTFHNNLWVKLSKRNEQTPSLKPEQNKI